MLIRPFTLLVLGVLCLPVPVRANGWEHGAIRIEVLLSALEFEHAETRRRAAESLGFRGQPEAVAPLVSALTRPEPDSSVRQSIYAALGRIGDPRAIPLLVTGLRAEKFDAVRATCAAAIGMLGDAHGLEPLLMALANDPSPLVHARVVDGLGHFRHSESIATLADLVLGETEDDLRLHAIAALGNTRSESAVAPLLRRLSVKSSRRERIAIADALAHIGSPKAVDAITSELHGEGDAELRAHLTVALAATRDGDVYGSLVEMLSDASRTVRYVAIRGLHDLGRAEAAEPLSHLSLEISSRVTKLPINQWLDDPEPVIADFELQASALRAIADLGPKVGLPALLAGAKPIAVPPDSAAGLALAERVYEVRRVAIYGLGYTRSREAAEFLAGENGIGDPDFRLRATAARSLGVLGFARTSRKLAPLLSDSQAEVRWTAALVLGRLKDPASGDDLLASLEDPHSEVRAQAALSLGYLSVTAALPRLRGLAVEDRSARVREAASLSAALLDR